MYIYIIYIYIYEYIYVYIHTQRKENEVIRVLIVEIFKSDILMSAFPALNFFFATRNTKLLTATNTLNIKSLHKPGYLKCLF